MTPIEDAYIRVAEFDSIWDGDTFWARIHLTKPGILGVSVRAKVRVHKWDAAELSAPEGAYMRDQFEQLLRAASRLRVKILRMSYDRVVCDVYLDDRLFAGLLARALRQFRQRRQQTWKRSER